MAEQGKTDFLDERGIEYEGQIMYNAKRFLNEKGKENERTQTYYDYCDDFYDGMCN